jgi:23S rRNA (uridine2552-2'-O)-methyltransferase
MIKKSSRLWLNEHFSDPYVKQAQLNGFRSRAVYKLLEIENKDHLFKPGMMVLDLGAAPGSWSQLIVQLVKPKGKVIAVDILPMEPIEGVEFIQEDFSNEAVLKLVYAHCLKEQGIDWVVSDMAPNMSGHESIDIPRSMYLAELTLDLSLSVLNTAGGCLMKVFQGEGFDSLLSECRKHYCSVVIRKPKASRDRSREVYILARRLKIRKI